MAYVYCVTPYSKLKIMQQDESLFTIDFISRSGTRLTTDDALLNETLSQIRCYMKSGAFLFDLPLSPQGTAFQQKVWDCLQNIPAGSVRTYGEIAAELHSSPRAVGNACRRNPIPLIIPCHRVVSAKGIGGFAGQTTGQKINIKEQLLRHEGVEI